MQKHVMIDLETLGTGTDAAVIAIGAVAFTRKEILATYEALIDPCLAPGSRDQRTIEWWAAQDEEVSERMMSGSTSPVSAMDGFFGWVRDAVGFKEGKSGGPFEGDAFLWANAPTFDCIILRSLCDAVDARFPFHFRDERCYRTLLSVARDGNKALAARVQGIYDARKGSAHDALSDAITQAQVCQAVFEALGIYGESKDE